MASTILSPLPASRPKPSTTASATAAPSTGSSTYAASKYTSAADGSEVYGLLGYQSFAGSDPRNRDIYFEASFRLLETEEWPPVEDTAGILIGADQIATIEFRNLEP